MSRHAVPKSSGSALHPRRAFKVAYILPSSVCSKSLVFHSYENCRGVLSFFPFWNSSLATHHSTPSPLECAVEHPMRMRVLREHRDRRISRLNVSALECALLRFHRLSSLECAVMKK